ncbi:MULTISPECIES: undecaprenyldiphospho-muramoylpentapeptide beta-N-acetylglucosaminyltransferase [unclassified Candidatus Paralachnospira]|uniref:undecaprenyldiphospho-muramoylpentapeptide beta-N-acetylglucosaminyltransferase n=1 Tax=unclassified Candidatus Paralachnospira TaxID=3099471 RepID=UPI0030625DFC
MKKIVLTGGGTAGHVTPNLALIPVLKEHGYEIQYLGSYHGIEKELIEKEGIPYTGISSGKLRRYFSLKNFSDPFRILKGYSQACRFLKKEKPDVIFSKGGFVSVPVVLAAKHLHIPAIIHESDMTPGLANKLCIPSARKVCCNFPETMKYLPADKAVLTGSPIRRELLNGSPLAGYQFTGFSSEKPVLLIIGGSLGSVKVNQAVRSILPELLKTWQVVHLCGKGNLDLSLDSLDGYVQYEYISSELKDLFAMSDLMISRAGANSICEILALRKPNILIPLSAAASRGDQILNANSFKKQGFSEVIQEEELTDTALLSLINQVYSHRQDYIHAMNKSKTADAIGTIVQLIEEAGGA